jgi:MarR family transcriptional regulator, organic hydroperoxide resistance regulator
MADHAPSFGREIRRTHRAFERRLAEALAPFGLQPGYWWYLRALWDEDSVSQRRLSEATGVAENTTMVMIGKMERDGLVTRRRDPADRRRMIVSLTAHGRALNAQLLPLAAAINRRAVANLSPGDAATVLAALAQMRVNLD